MIVRCQECGSKNVFDLGFNINKETVDVYAMNDSCHLNKDTLPYYIGGYYCADCQTFCQIIEEPEPADQRPISEKQKDFLLSLVKKLKIEQEWPEDKISAMNQKEAGKLIWKLKQKYDKRPKRKIAMATDRQKKYIKSLIEKSANKAKYSTKDIDAMNIIEANKTISELLDEKKAE